MLNTKELRIEIYISITHPSEKPNEPNKLHLNIQYQNQDLPFFFQRKLFFHYFNSSAPHFAMVVIPLVTLGSSACEMDQA